MSDTLGPAATDCTCDEWCSDDYPGCPYCEQIASYDPCPTFGFGCGLGAKNDTDPCDCCGPEQWAAARSVS